MLAGLVAGCSGTTYGTGISPEQQTVTDLMGIASLGANSDAADRVSAARRHRAAAQSRHALPVPGSGPSVAAIETDPNWPKDPDVEARERKAAKRASFGQPSPNFVLPAGQTSIGNAQLANNADDEQRRAEGKKAWDDLHQSKKGSVDANGNPTRRYLDRAAGRLSRARSEPADERAAQAEDELEPRQVSGPSRAEPRLDAGRPPSLYSAASAVAFSAASFSAFARRFGTTSG